MRVPRWGVSVAAVAALVGAGLSVPQVAMSAGAPSTAWSPAAAGQPPKAVLPAGGQKPWRPRSTASPINGTQGKSLARAAAAATVGAPGLGELPWFTFEKFPVSKTSVAQVNVANGNLLVKANDLAIASPGSGFRQDRFYNSLATEQGTPQATAAGDLGSGWEYNASRADIGLDIQSTYTDFHGPNGTVVRFPGAKGKWTSPAGANMTLTMPTTGDASYVVTINRSGEQWQFDGYGQLFRTVDRNGVGEEYTQYIEATGSVKTYAPGASSTGKPYFQFDFVQDADEYTPSMTDSAGRKWTYDGGNIRGFTAVHNPDGTQTQYTYAGDRLASIISPSAVSGQTSTTSFTYDGQGRIATVSQQITAQGSTAVTKFSYASGVTTQTDPNGNVSSYQVDSQGRVTKTTDGRGKSRAQSWTANSDVQTATDGLTAANVTKYEFDGNNNTTKASLPTGAAATASYSVGGSCSVANSGTVYEPKCSTDASGNKATFQYDTAGNLLQRNDTTSSTAKITAKYTYEKPGGSVCGGIAGQVCSSTDGNGNTTKNTYDTSGNLLKVTPPAPLGATTYTYDSLNRVTSVTDGKGQKTQYTYDVTDRIVKTTYSNGSAVTTSYYPNGLAKTVVDSAGGTQQFTYDARGALTAQTGPNAVSAAQYGYDANGNLTAATDASGTVGYGYDAANNLTQVADPGRSCPTGSAAPAAESGCVRLQYDDNEQESTRQLPGGATISISRDNSARPVRITAKDTTGAAKFDVGYSYAKAGTDQGLIQTRTSYAEQGITAGAVTTYGYDSKSELTSAVEAAGGAMTASWAYAYDGAGNRTSQSLAGATNSPRSGTTTFTYNAANQLTKTSADTAAWGYDADGVQTKNGITGAAQTVDPRLAVTSTGTGGANSYFGDGNTTRTTAGSTAYGTTPLGITSISSNGATSSYTRTPTGALIDGRRSAGSFYYVTDAIGSVTGLFDATGAWAGGYSYAPYGETRSISTNAAVTANPFRYISGLNEGGNLYKLGARYYDADLGRFTQMDPSGQETNPYAYASCNPINATDPSGLTCTHAIEALAGVDLGIGAGVVAVVLGVVGEIPSLALDTPATILAVAGLAAATLGRGAAVDAVNDQCSKRTAAIALALV